MCGERERENLLTEPFSVLLVDTLRWNTRAGSVSFSLSEDSSAIDATTPAGDVCGRGFFFESSLFGILFLLLWWFVIIFFLCFRPFNHFIYLFTYFERRWPRCSFYFIAFVCVYISIMCIDETYDIISNNVEGSTTDQNAQWMTIRYIRAEHWFSYFIWF